MEYKVYEADPEMEQNTFLYILMVKWRSFGTDEEKLKWTIHGIFFSRAGLERMLTDIEGNFEAVNRYKLDTRDVAVLKVKLPPNVRETTAVNNDQL